MRLIASIVAVTVWLGLWLLLLAPAVTAHNAVPGCERITLRHAPAWTFADIRDTNTSYYVYRHVAPNGVYGVPAGWYYVRWTDGFSITLEVKSCNETPTPTPSRTPSPTPTPSTPTTSPTPTATAVPSPTPTATPTRAPTHTPATSASPPAPTLPATDTETTTSGKPGSIFLILIGLVGIIVGLLLAFKETRR